MIAGLEKQTQGEVQIGGRLVNDVPPQGRDIAMVFQSYALYPHMNVYENMAFGLKLRGLSKDLIDQRVKAAAETLGIGELLKRRPRELSGGQRQRVALGRAIVREPQVFLMDEPLSNLDAKLRVAMRTEIAKLHNRLKITTVYVTHDQTEAMTMGERIVVLKDGVIQQVDTPNHLYRYPANQFVAGFIGTPPMNFVSGRLEQRGNSRWFSNDTFSLEIPPEIVARLKDQTPRPVVLGIRPEDISDESAFVDAHPDWVLTPMVEVTEPMGAEVYLYLAAGSHSLIARVDPATEAKDGAEWKVAVNMSKVHLFDAETQQTLLNR
jgi:multiple sugar transport system ATP-binding protein